MKKLSKLMLTFTAMTACVMLLCSAAPDIKSSAAADAKSYQGSNGQTLKIGIVNFKKCVEESKVGKQEQANFENMKKQMESVLAEKEKTLNDMATKFNDADYLDSLSPEAETDLKRKFRSLNQELAGQQQQFMQTLQQNNMKVIQKLNDLVSKASNTIAKNEKLDLIFNEEASFFYAPNIDLSSKVIALMDEEFEKQAKEAKMGSGVELKK